MNPLTHRVVHAGANVNNGIVQLRGQLMIETHDKKVVKENINSLSKSVEHGRDANQVVSGKC